MATARGHLRLLPPRPTSESRDDLGVLAVCFLAGIVPWLGLALLGHWSGAELGLSLLLLGAGLAEAACFAFPSRHRSPRR